jgi:ABC-type sugar transport system ATPase subunit
VRDGLAHAGRNAALRLTVRSGEVVGGLGPSGSGQSTLYPVLSGMLQPANGTLAVNGRPVPLGSITASLRSGLRCITGDRLRLGLVGGLSVNENIVMAKDRLARRSWIGWGALRRRAVTLRDRFGVVTLQQDPPVAQLSGGNQQKVLLAKWLESSPGVVFLEEPTNGVDVAAKAEIHRMIDELAAAGTAILIASSDVHEVMRLRPCRRRQRRAAHGEPRCRDRFPRRARRTDRRREEQ